MNRFACQYAIVRFLPYAETGEFANVGVVLACPATGYFGTRLMPPKKTKRIAGFFEQLDMRVYREAMAYLKEELSRLRELIQDVGDADKQNFVQRTFAGLIRPREEVLRLSEARAILAGQPAETLNQLFGKLVERDFANKEYHDQLLIRGVRETLRKASLREYFKPGDIGNQDLHIHAPFVHERDGRTQLAIKPLDLAKDEPNLVYDLGGHWVDRMRRLQRHQLLPEAMLFAVKLPDTKYDRARAAVEEILGDLRGIEAVNTAAIGNEAAIAKFAAGAVASH